MFCKKCGNEIPDNSKFCTFCGESFVASPATSHRAVCPNCAGEGKKRSVMAIILSIIGVLILFSIQSYMATVLLVLGAGEGSIIFWVLCMLFDGWILYFGFKKKDCNVCHGLGRIGV